MNYSKDYYKLLRIAYPSNQKEIHLLYRKLSKLYHPDSGGSESQMKELNEAYRILSNPVSKEDYDKWYVQNCRPQKNKTEVKAHVLDFDCGYYIEKILLDNIKADYNKYKDENGDVYIIMQKENGQKKKIILEKYIWQNQYDKYVELQNHSHQSQTGDSSHTHRTVTAYVLDSGILGTYSVPINGRSIYIEHIDESLLPSDYQKYIADDGILYIFKSIVGGKQKLWIVDKNSWEKAAYPNMQQPKKRNKLQRFFDNRATASLLSILVIACICFVIIVIDNASTKEQRQINDSSAHQTAAPVKTAVPAQTTDPVQTAAPRKEPLPHGYTKFNYDENGNTAPLEIITKDTSNIHYYYMKIENMSGEVVQTIFIHAGQSIETFLPYGIYSIKWACGQEWYGTDNLFGVDTIYQKADETFEFYSDNEYSYGHTLTLYNVTNGNLGTTDINASDF